MTRPSTHTDRSLLKAGRELLPKAGCSGLSLREVARRAKVNLGMFHYHFKNKADFTRQLLQDIYEEFFKNFSIESSQGKNSLEKLRSSLLAVGIFSRDNHKLFFALMKDMMSGDTVVIEFIRQNLSRHASVILDLLMECQEEGLVDPTLDVSQGIAFCMTSINMPSLIHGTVSKIPFKNKWGHLQKIDLSSDEAITERVDLALKAIQLKSKKKVSRRSGK